VTEIAFDFRMKRHELIHNFVLRIRWADAAGIAPRHGVTGRARLRRVRDPLHDDMMRRQSRPGQKSAAGPGGGRAGRKYGRQGRK
jgi:hypothetical protein